MRYLKKYNESNDLENLQDFCEMSLVYLLDDGFEVTTKYITNRDVYCIKITNIDTPLRLFKWDSIKNYFIPFMKMINNNYQICNDFWYHSFTFEPHYYWFNPLQLKTGILFHYLKPTAIHDSQWFLYPVNRTVSSFEPTVNQILYDHILDNAETIHYNYNCMNYLHEINILVIPKSWSKINTEE
jgi:hypothetical protein